MGEALLKGLLSLSESSSFVDSIVPRLITTDVLSKTITGLRNGWTSDLVNVTTSTAHAYDFSSLPATSILRIGQPLDLFVTLPVVGSLLNIDKAFGVLPALPTADKPDSEEGRFLAAITSLNTNADLWRLPEGSSFLAQWKLYKSDFADNGAMIPAVQASSIDDAEGHYQLLNGSLTSTLTGQSQVVFWPSPAPNDRRLIMACLETSGMVNDGLGAVVKARKLCFGNRLQSWQDLLGPITDNKFSQAAAEKIKAKFPASFQNLFDITIDTNAPVAGVASTIRVLPLDKSKILAPRLDTILDHAPNLKFSAALDLGAPLNAWINAGVNAVTGLFKPSSGGRAARKISGGILDVADVLTGALTVPFALNVQGSTVTKTLKPLLGTEALPSLSQLPGLNTVTGALPIGALTAQLKSTINNLTATIVGSNTTTVVIESLDEVLGLSVLVAPQLVAAGSKPVKNNIVLEIKINPAIILPGLKTPLFQEIVLGTITIVQPTIIIPQIGMFFHGKDYLGEEDHYNALVAIDPSSYRLLSSVNQVVVFLTDLVDLVSRVKDLFPDGLSPTALVDSVDGLEGLLTMAGTMLNYFKNTESLSLELWDFGKPGHDFFDTSADGDFDIDDETLGVSAMLWLGLPISPWRLQMQMGAANAPFLIWGNAAKPWQLTGWCADFENANSMSDSLMVRGGQPYKNNIGQFYADNQMTVIRFVRA